MPRSQSSQRIWWREAEIFLAWNRKKLPRIHRLTGVEFKNFYSSRGGIVCSAAKDCEFHRDLEEPFSQLASQPGGMVLVVCNVQPRSQDPWGAVYQAPSFRPICHLRNLRARPLSSFVPCVLGFCICQCFRNALFFLFPPRA